MILAEKTLSTLMSILLNIILEYQIILFSQPTPAYL